MGALLGTLASVLAFAVLVLLGVLVWRERRAAALTRAADQLAAIVRDGRYTDRVHTGSIAGRLADNANRLLEQMAMRDLMINERERSLVGLLSLAAATTESGCTATARCSASKSC